MLSQVLGQFPGLRGEQGGGLGGGFAAKGSHLWYIIIYQEMANVHGFNNLNGGQGGNRGPAAGRQGLGVRDPLLEQELAQDKIPFMNTLKSDRPALEETIPYTLKIVWCPSIKILSISVFFCVAIWVIYIFCLTQGIDSSTGRQIRVLGPTYETLRKYGAVERQLIKDGEVWRLITAGFLHADLMHISMNTLSILFLLTRIEAIYNPLIVGAFMLISLVAGNIMSATINTKDNFISVGASTIIYGVFGALLAYMTINWQSLGAIRNQICCIVAMIIIFTVLFSLDSSVDFGGHLGGFIGGYLSGIMLFPGIRPKNNYLTLAGAGALAAYFLVMFLVFFLA